MLLRSRTRRQQATTTTTTVAQMRERQVIDCYWRSHLRARALAFVAAERARACVPPFIGLRLHSLFSTIATKRAKNERRVLSSVVCGRVPVKDGGDGGGGGEVAARWRQVAAVSARTPSNTRARFVRRLIADGVLNCRMLRARARARRKRFRLFARHGERGAQMLSLARPPARPAARRVLLPSSCASTRAAR